MNRKSKKNFFESLFLKKTKTGGVGIENGKITLNVIKQSSD